MPIRQLLELPARHQTPRAAPRRGRRVSPPRAAAPREAAVSLACSRWDDGRQGVGRGSVATAPAVGAEGRRGLSNVTQRLAQEAQGGLTAKASIGSGWLGRRANSVNICCGSKSAVGTGGLARRVRVLRGEPGADPTREPAAHAAHGGKRSGPGRDGPGCEGRRAP